MGRILFISLAVQALGIIKQQILVLSFAADFDIRDMDL
jgi:hypothetical protein